MTHSSIKFIKSLEKVGDDTWLYTPGKYKTALYRMWIKAHPFLGGKCCRIHTQPPTDDYNTEANVFTDSRSIYDACTDILKWFWDLTDYQNDPSRLAALDENYAKGIGPIPEFVIHPKYSDILSAADMQLKERETISELPKVLSSSY